MDCFSCDPVFVLHHYRPGELLASPFEKNRYLQFIVEGEILLYDMPSADSFTSVGTPFYYANLIGENELVDPDFRTFFVEAKTDVYTLALSVEEYGDRLMNDNVFLRYVCRTMSRKLDNVIKISHKVTLREQMMRYLAMTDCTKPIHDLQHLAQLLHVSSRQLSRTLIELCDEGYLEREKKGVYRITDKIIETVK